MTLISKTSWRQNKRPRIVNVRLRRRKPDTTRNSELLLLLTRSAAVRIKVQEPLILMQATWRSMLISSESKPTTTPTIWNSVRTSTRRTPQVRLVRLGKASQSKAPTLSTRAQVKRSKAQQEQGESESPRWTSEWASKTLLPRPMRGPSINRRRLTWVSSKTALRRSRVTRTQAPRFLRIGETTTNEQPSRSRSSEDAEGVRWSLHD